MSMPGGFNKPTSGWEHVLCCGLPAQQHASSTTTSTVRCIGQLLAALGLRSDWKTRSLKDRYSHSFNAAQHELCFGLQCAGRCVVRHVTQETRRSQETMLTSQKLVYEMQVE